MKHTFHVLVISVFMSACAAPTRGANSDNLLPLTHCRVDKTVGWPISQIEPDDIRSKSGRSFEIVRQGNGREDSPIAFQMHDRITIEDGRLVHVRLRDGWYADVASAELAIDNTTRLWASGPAFVPGRKHPVGVYVVYRTADSDGSPRYCKHKKHSELGTEKCTTLRFEYFDHNDLENQSHKPKLEKGNVEPLPSAACETGPRETAEGDGPRQTGEGDGDDGPN